MEIIQKTIKEIRNLKIQGATNVALASLKALKKDYQGKKYQDLRVLRKKIKQLKSSRLTEPLLFNCLDYVYLQVRKENDLSQLPEVIKDLLCQHKEIWESIVEYGVSLIKKGMTVLTHCHSTSVVEIFREAKRRGKNFKVFLTETRPKYQGRITARELIKAKIPATLVVDSAAAFVISKEDRIPINLVLLGCDAIYPEKGVLNKIGSFNIALSAYEAKISLFIAGSLLKTSKKMLEIEEREGEEIWEKKPQGLKILNLAFDFIPRQFIRGIITEFGIIKPNRISQLVEKHYPFISRKPKTPHCGDEGRKRE